MKSNPDKRDQLFKEALQNLFDGTIELTSAHYAYFSIFLYNLNQQIKIQLNHVQSRQGRKSQKDDDQLDEYLQQMLNNMIQKVNKQTQQIITNNTPIKVSKSSDNNQILDPPEASILQYLYQMQCNALQQQNNIIKIETQFDQLINRLINRLNSLDEQFDKEKGQINEIQKQYDFYQIALFRVMSTLYSLYVYCNKLKSAFGTLQLLGQITRTQNQEQFVRNQYFKLQIQCGIYQQQNLTTPIQVVNDLSEMQNSQIAQNYDQTIGNESISPSIIQNSDQKQHEVQNTQKLANDTSKNNNTSFSQDSDSYIYQKLINDGLVSLYNEGAFNAYKVYDSLEKGIVSKSGNQSVADLNIDTREFLSAVHINKRVLSIFAGSPSEIFRPDEVLLQYPGLITVSAHKISFETQD